MNHPTYFSEDEVNLSEYFQDEHEVQLIETKGRIEGAIKLAQEVMDETFKDEESKCIELKLFVEKYESWFLETNKYPFVHKKSYCFYLKLPEINNTLNDFFLLLMSGKYTSSLSLMRKFLELVIHSIYFDRAPKTSKAERERKAWLDGKNPGNVSLKSKLERICTDKTDVDELMEVYKHLSSYTHNAGAKKSFALFYDNDKFEEVYSYAMELDKILEKLLHTSYT